MVRSTETIIADLLKADLNRGQLALLVELLASEKFISGSPVKTLEGPTYVYALVDPRSGLEFYVGITNQPACRLANHKSDPCSAAKKRIEEIEASGGQCEMVILAEYEVRDEAREHEYRLITSMNGLLNKAAAPPFRMSADVRSVSADAERMERRRKLDRERKKANRHAGKQTISGSKTAPEKAAERPPDAVRTRADSAVSSLFETQGSLLPARKIKKEVRGSRITREFVLGDAERKFTTDRGFSPDAEVAEFIDYWIGVPGNRGLKLDWPATYRNRIRFKSEKNGGGNGQHRQSGASGNRQVGGHRSWASYAVARARAASGEGT